VWDDRPLPVRFLFFVAISAATERRASTPEEVFRQESGSLSPPATFPAVPDRNCVTVRWCGEHRKGSDQSVG
jgi:hypothetical protein